VQSNKDKINSKLNEVSKILDRRAHAYQELFRGYELLADNPARIVIQDLMDSFYRLNNVATPHQMAMSVGEHNVVQHILDQLTKDITEAAQ